MTAEITKSKTVTTRRRTGFADFIVRLFKEKPMGTVGGIIVFLLLVVGIFANFIAPEGYNVIHLMNRFAPPSTSYLLGTDQLGRDMLSRIIYGARISVIIGIGASAIATAISGVIAITSGFIGGKFDLFVQRLVDAWLCFPSLIILLSAMAIIGSGILQVTLVLGIVNGIGGSRLVRSAVITVRQNIYVDASKAIGASTPFILMQHILPNVVPFLVIYFTVSMAGMILSEAGLSFLGFGIPPPQPSWGGMLSMEGRAYMLQAPWMAFWPGLALSVVIYGVNMFGDAVRDLLDPRLRGGLGRYGRIDQAHSRVKKLNQP